jgi:hypothetical protein
MEREEFVMHHKYGQRDWYVQIKTKYKSTEFVIDKENKNEELKLVIESQQKKKRGRPKKQE